MPLINRVGGGMTDGKDVKIIKVDVYNISYDTLYVPVKEMQDFVMITVADGDGTTFNSGVPYITGVIYSKNSDIEVIDSEGVRRYSPLVYTVTNGFEVSARVIDPKIHNIDDFVYYWEREKKMVFDVNHSESVATDCHFLDSLEYTCVCY